eukprot:15125647-Alexandrium_andersonii.AAC.1
MRHAEWLGWAGARGKKWSRASGSLWQHVWASGEDELQQDGNGRSGSMWQVAIGRQKRQHPVHRHSLWQHFVAP